MEGILPPEAATFRMEEAAEEKIEGTALIPRGDLELACGPVAGQRLDRRGKWRVP